MDTVELDGDFLLTVFSILEALVLLLEKDSKNRREPSTPEPGLLPFPNLKVATEFSGCVVMPSTNQAQIHGGTSPASRSPELSSTPVSIATSTARSQTQAQAQGKTRRPLNASCPLTDLILQEINRV